MKKPFEWEEHPDKLVLHEFVPNGRTLEKGGNTRINHDSDDCSGDSTSLKIARRPDGKIVAYCFRCKRTGIFRGDMERELPRKMNGTYLSGVSYTAPSEREKFVLPGDMTYNFEAWPVQAKMFLKRAHLGQKDVTDWSIGFSPSLRKVVVPLYKKSTNTNLIDGLIGYQLRRVFDTDLSPKYLTRKNEEEYYELSRTNDDLLCIVEDKLSFIRCSEHVSTMCLFGTSLSAPMLGRISDNVGRKPILLLSILISTASFLLFFTSQLFPCTPSL